MLTVEMKPSGPRAALLLIVIYLRVSTQDQGRSGYSLPEQEISCRKKAEELARDWAVKLGPVEQRIVVFQDDISGDFDREVRDGLDAALTYCENLAADWFICMDPDRLGRSAHLSLSISHVIERTGAKLAFVLHEYQMTPEGKLFFSLRVSVAEYEKAKILERTSRGKRGARRQGRIPNHVDCYGYNFLTRAELDKAGLATLTAEGLNNQLQPDPTEARWVQEIFRWVHEERIGPKLIAYRLNGLGVPSKHGGRWNRGVLFTMLRNPIYAGTLIMNRWDFEDLGIWTNVRAEKRPSLEENKRPPITAKMRDENEWIEVKVPAIITRDEFDAVQEVLATSNRQARNRVRDDGSLKRKGFLLSGLGRCGLCGGSLQYAWNNKIKGYYIRCANKYPEKRVIGEQLPRCTAKLIRAAEFEEEVWKTLRSWFDDPALLQRYHETRKARVPSQTEEQASRILALQEQLQSLQAERARVVLMFRKGKMAEEAFDGVTDELDQQLEKLRQAIKESELGLSDLARRDFAVEKLVDSIQSMREQVLNSLDQMPLAQRQHVIRTVFRSVVKIAGQPAEYEL
jgi:site-specific DNA recombinase